MEFPEKCVLLLGKEKEGIPIQFLSAVDQCIEIPQLGITRSLNVHVSGAISIWEYTKQMMKSPT
jgi:tRNA G18 (ribose-2'-O)-methylase SpoU